MSPAVLVLLLLLKILTSSASVHQFGYGLVLANTSDIFDVLGTAGGSFLLILLDFLLCVWDAVIGVPENGSTCTISEEL